MSPLEIKIALLKNGITQKSIADECQVHPVHVSEIIKGYRVSNRVMKAIAARLGKDPREVFPWYFINGTRRSRSMSNL